MTKIRSLWQWLEWNRHRVVAVQQCHILYLLDVKGLIGKVTNSKPEIHRNMTVKFTANKVQMYTFAPDGFIAWMKAALSVRIRVIRQLRMVTILHWPSSLADLISSEWYMCCILNLYIILTCSDCLLFVLLRQIIVLQLGELCPTWYFTQSSHVLRVCPSNNHSPDDSITNYSSDK